MLPAILEHFAPLQDPRIERTRLHSLPDILGIALCAVICGAESWVEIEAYGRAKQEWLRQWLGLAKGIPSHDTFARVFARLAPRELGRCMQAVTQHLASAAEKFLSIDGKYLRHSFHTAQDKGPLVMLNAWAGCQRLVLASLPVDQKSNEIKAVPELLALLDIAGCTVTCDAMGCQKAIATQSVAQGGDYVLALKGNQESVHTDVQNLFDHAEQHRWEGVTHTTYEQTEWGHARQEIRRCTVVPLSALEGRWNDVQQTWTGLQSLIRIESTRVMGGKSTQETRYYLSSLRGTAKQALKAVRSHWGVENSLHYVLDVAFNEDDCRIRKDNAPANFSLVRQIALNLLRQEKTCKNGIKVKRSKAAWDDTYLLRVLDSCSHI